MTVTIPVGSRWLEVATSRVIVVDGGASNWWHYEDDPKRTRWHCCVEDFVIWKRFRRIS